MSCQSGQTECAGTCVDTSSNRSHCGSCGTSCGAGEVCSSGSCEVSCQSGQTNCSGSCVDTSSNPDHCGACGNTCSQSQACLGGACEALADLEVLIFHDVNKFSGGSHPAELAADDRNWPHTTVFEDGSSFETEYNSQSWDLVVIDASTYSLPSEVETIAENRANNQARLIFTYYDLDANSALQTALEVNADSYSNPETLVPTSGASVNFFTYEQTFPDPLNNTDDFVDNGDYLTTTSGGEVVITGNNASRGVAALTNNQSSLVLGFLPPDFANVDGDSDGMTDLTEMYVNMYVWFLNN